MKLAYHYTIGVHFKSIVEDGAILPATKYIPPGEKPIVWFSTCDTFEPTARKQFMSHGKVRLLSVQETGDRGGGLVRLSMDASKLIQWPTLGIEAAMSRTVRRSLERAGRDQGSNPEWWFGTFVPVDADECGVDVYQAGEWISVRALASGLNDDLPISSTNLSGGIG